MKVRYELVQKVEGTMEEVITIKPEAPKLGMHHIIQSLNDLAFIVETVAHLQGKPELLKASDKARTIITALQGE